MAQATVQPDHQFRRELSLLDLTMASMGAIIGSGWLFGSLRAANLAGPSALLSWVIGGIAVMLIGLVYAELGAMAPEAGGLVRYPQYSHGSLVSFLMGWTAWIAYAAVVSIEAEAVVQYANKYLAGLYDVNSGVLTVPGLLLAAVLMVVFFLLNYFGVALFARINTTVTLIKFVVPILTAVVLLTFGFHGGNFGRQGFAPGGSSGILSAVSTAGVLFAYLGFRQAIDMAGEARNPQRDVPRAIITSIILAMILYLLLQAAFIVGVQPGQLSGGWKALKLATPFVDVATGLGIGWLAVLLLIDAAISPAGTGFVYTGSNARVAYALARNGYLPAPLTRVHDRFRVPSVALITNLIIGLAFLLPFPSWAKLVGIVTDGVALTYIAGPVAAATLRRTAPGAARPVRIGGLAAIAPVAFAVAGLIIFWSGWPAVGQVLILTLVGLPIYFYYYAQGKYTADHIRAGIWLVGYLIFMIIVSYLGSFGGKKVLPYGPDMLVVIAGSLVAYYVGVTSGIVTEESRTLSAAAGAAPLSAQRATP